MPSKPAYRKNSILLFFILCSCFKKQDFLKFCHKRGFVRLQLKWATPIFFFYYSHKIESTPCSVNISNCIEIISTLLFLIIYYFRERILPITTCFLCVSIYATTRIFIRYYNFNFGDWNILNWIRVNKRYGGFKKKVTTLLDFKNQGNTFKKKEKGDMNVSEDFHKKLQ